MTRFKKCWHSETFVLKRYRKNYPFGRKSKVRFFDPPQSSIKICKRCGAVLNIWKSNGKEKMLHMSRRRR